MKELTVRLLFFLNNSKVNSKDFHEKMRFMMIQDKP